MDKVPFRKPPEGIQNTFTTLMKGMQEEVKRGNGKHGQSLGLQAKKLVDGDGLSHHSVKDGGHIQHPVGRESNISGAAIFSFASQTQGDDAAIWLSVSEI